MSHDPVSTSAAERLGWQRRTVRLLDTLLDRAQRDGLPVLAWTIAHTGASLLGHCYAADIRTRQADFETWRRVLIAPAWPERMTSDGTVRLYAVVKHYDGLVDVVLVAELIDTWEQGEDG